MPRLSLYRPQKGNDYKFIDKTVWEMFQVGGTDVFIHKYLGPKITPVWSLDTAYAANDLVSLNNTVYKARVANTGITPPNDAYWEFVREGSPSQPIYTAADVANIDDLLFLENRNRDYDDDVYILRGIYNLQDIDFNLSQFGLFLQNDTIFLTFHINDTVEKLSRKLIAGDVLELPHLIDEYALADSQYLLKRFYVIEEISRAAEGYSVTWYPHLYRAKCKPMTASQEFQDILDTLVNPEDPNSPTIGEQNTTYDKEMQITQSILDQAEEDAPRSGYDTAMFYTLQTDEMGRAILETVDSETLDASVETQATDEAGYPLFDKDGNPIYVGSTASTMLLSAAQKGYRGYITEDGKPVNGAPFTSGIGFPNSPVVGQFCLRTDYLPNRLFRYNGTRWIKQEDNIRMTMSNKGSHDGTIDRGSWVNTTLYDKNDLVNFNGLYYVSKVNGNVNIIPSSDATKWQAIRATQKTSFINNTNVTTIDGHSIDEKQSLSKALRPKADE